MQKRKKPIQRLLCSCRKSLMIYFFQAQKNYLNIKSKNKKLDIIKLDRKTSIYKICPIKIIGNE